MDVVQVMNYFVLFSTTEFTECVSSSDKTVCRK